MSKVNYKKWSKRQVPDPKVADMVARWAVKRGFLKAPKGKATTCSTCGCKIHRPDELGPVLNPIQEEWVRAIVYLLELVHVEGMEGG